MILLFNSNAANLNLLMKEFNYLIYNYGLQF